MTYQGGDGPVGRFEAWLRDEFVEGNTVLEQAYFAARREVVSEPALDEIKRAIANRGSELVAAIGEQGAVDADAQDRYQLLGAVGFYLAACRRHEIEHVLRDDLAEEVLSPAWSLALRLGSSLGVAPRYVFAHQSIYNPAVDGIYRRFTTLEDEQVFVTGNALAVLAYQRASSALRAIAPMGVSSPMSGYLFEQARAALDEVLRFDQQLSQSLDVDRFFFNIRPYFKPYQVGATLYRGANAGDFSAVNEVDLLLGLCRASDPFYQGFLTEKYPYVPPADQARLQQAVTETSLLDRFLTEARADRAGRQLRSNGESFLAVCRAHGAAAVFHHHRLVKSFLVTPAQSAPPERLDDLTASGPPLDVVVAGLERLSDLRAAHDRPGVPSARAALDRLHNLLRQDPA